MSRIKSGATLAAAVLACALGLGACASDTRVRAAVYVPTGPPAPVSEVVTVSPGPGYIWIPGYHQWNGSAYVWVGGRWDIGPRPNARWVGGRWRHSGRGWYWVPGHWR